MTKGRFIIIEGADGSGKTTQTRLLVKRLAKGKIRVVEFDFPQYEKTFFGKMIGRYLVGEFGNRKEVDPFLSSLLYAGDRWQVKEKIKRAILAGKIVIANRYATTNMVYQSLNFSFIRKKQSDFISWLKELEYKTYQIPRPDLVLFLDVPFEISYNLTGGRNPRAYLKGKKRDILEAELDYQKQVYQTYKWLCRREKNWVRIDCSFGRGIDSVENIHRKIWKAVFD